MVKNYVVMLLAKINKSNHWGEMLNKYETYKKMSKLVEKSCIKYCADMDEFIYFSGQKEIYNNIEEFFTDIIPYLKKLWSKEKCNIFVVGSDTLIINPTKIFGEYEDFMLFSTCVQGNPFKHIGYPSLLDSCRYYPHTMEKNLWDIGEKYWENKSNDPNGNDWGFEMYVNNHMFYAQRNGKYKNKENLLKILEPRMMYQNMENRIYGYNGQISVNQGEKKDAYIIHYGATRGIERIYKLMLDDFNQYVK